MIGQMRLDEAMLTDAGRARDGNEDSLGSFHNVLPFPFSVSDTALLDRKGRLYVVADGVGGHDHGKLASETAVKALCSAYYSSPDDDPLAALKHALAQANTEVYQRALALRRPGARSMGTTIVCAVIVAGQLILAHLGDSRAYRQRDGHLTPLTTDHDWITEYIRIHDVSRQEAELQAQEQGARGALLRAMGFHPVVQPDYRILDWREGDTLLLCSDGLHSLVNNESIKQILAANPPTQAARKLIEAANSAGGYDNITAIVVRGDTRSLAADTKTARRPQAQIPSVIISIVSATLLLLIGIVGAGLLSQANGPSNGLVPPNAGSETATVVQTLQPTSGLLPTVTPLPPTATRTSTPTQTSTPTPRPTSTPTLRVSPRPRPSPPLATPLATDPPTQTAEPLPTEAPPAELPTETLPAKLPIQTLPAELLTPGSESP